jgi:Pyridoxamine 5'-phosphate oxidase
MNFVVVDGLIVLRTAAHSTAARKIDQAIVAFEADELDAAHSSGWSVVVTGRAEAVNDAEMITVPGAAAGAVGTRSARQVRDDHDRAGQGRAGTPRSLPHFCPALRVCWADDVSGGEANQPALLSSFSWFSCC